MGSKAERGIGGSHSRNQGAMANIRWGTENMHRERGLTGKGARAVIRRERREEEERRREEEVREAFHFLSHLDMTGREIDRFTTDGDSEVTITIVDLHTLIFIGFPEMEENKLIHQ